VIPPLLTPPGPAPPGLPVNQGSPGDTIPVGRILAGGLRVLDRLGSTPEGPLYHAEYPNGVEVALVVLSSEAVGSEPFRRERFGRATQIQHPNVAAVYEVGQMEDGSVYVVLEQLVGEPLSNLLATGQVFALPAALDLTLQAAAGLKAAHRVGFIHGSLSPHTILVTPAAHERSQVKLIGFTLDPPFRQRGAKPPIPEEASTGYASPERLAGHPLDERSDVFSLGAVLHHLLTGMPPGQGHVDTSVPKVARAVLDTALAPVPARRFQTTSELEAALEQLAAVAGKRKRTAIHRALLIGAVGAGLALVTGGIWLLPGSKWRAASEELHALVAGTMDLGGAEPGLPTTREAPPAPSPARAPPAARQDAPRTRNSPADSDRSPAGASAKPAPRATRPQSAPAALADAEAPPPLPTQPTPPAVEKLENRQTEESPETAEALGYVGEPAPSSVPNPPDSTPAPQARQSRATLPIGTLEVPRSRAELELDQGLRQSIGDVMRLGIAEDVAEIRPGFLQLSLTSAAMHVPSVTYNLQRLYLAYSAATEHRDEVALELRHGRDLYGWFTRDGLRQASSE
jgi:serine/threonine protein kinase